jgi:hypothetical protein
MSSKDSHVAIFALLAQHKNRTEICQNLGVSGTGFYLAKASGDVEDTTFHCGKERHFANLQVITIVGSDGQKCHHLMDKSAISSSSRTRRGLIP